MSLPPNVSQTAFDAALKAWRLAVGPTGCSRKPLTWRSIVMRTLRSSVSRKSAWPRLRLRPQVSSKCRRWCARRTSIAFRSIRFRPAATLLWRLRARAFRQRRARSQADESRARSERAQRVCSSSRASATSICTTTSRKRSSTCGSIHRIRAGAAGIGNALDGGAGWTASPYRDHFASHCGLEVVLADGEVVAHWHGRAAQLQVVAAQPLGLWPWSTALPPVQLRRRHEDGHLSARRGRKPCRCRSSPRRATKTSCRCSMC